LLCPDAGRLITHVHPLGHHTAYGGAESFLAVTRLIVDVPFPPSKGAV